MVYKYLMCRMIYDKHCDVMAMVFEKSSYAMYHPEKQCTDENIGKMFIEQHLGKKGFKKELFEKSEEMHRGR